MTAKTIANTAMALIAATTRALTGVFLCELSGVGVVFDFLFWVSGVISGVIVSSFRFDKGRMKPRLAARPFNLLSNKLNGPLDGLSG